MFGALTLIALIAAGVALLRQRTALFFIAANEAITLRSLTSIQEHGRPFSQSFLPTYVFSDANLMTASQVFMLALAITCLAVAMPARRPRREVDPATLPALPTLVMVGIGIHFVLLTASPRTLFSSAYAVGQIRFDPPAGGLQALMVDLTIYELYRRVRVGLLTPGKALGVLLGLLTVTDFIKGSTGLATGFVFTGLILFFSGSRLSLSRWLVIGAVMLSVASLVLVIRSMRAYVHSEGTEAVVNATDVVWNAEGQRDNRGEGLDERANGSQTAAHVLECITLYDAGHSREWRSYWTPLIYTFQPSFLLKTLNITRPREAAWELGDYFVHGGGISIFGEMYWNGGFFCIFVIMSLLVALAYFTDTSFRFGFAHLILYCMFVPSLLQGTQYGIAYMVRGVANAGLVLAIYMIVARRRAGPAPAPERAPAAS